MLRLYYNHDMNRFITYLRDTKTELNHVSWPTQRQTIIYTALVIVLSIVTAVYLGVADYGFSQGLDFILFR